MRQRRNKRFANNTMLNNLILIKRILFVLILFFLITFIYSSIKYKNSINNFEENTQSIAIDDPDFEISSISEDKNQKNDISQDENSISENNEISNSNKSTTINLTFTGDIMCHNTIYNDAYDKFSEAYDFSYIFDDIKYYIQIADLAVGNLETTFAGSEKKYSSYPTFNTPEALAYNLKKVGFDVVSTANNHCYDSGYVGVEHTIDFLDDADISHTGTYKSEEDQKHILIKNVKGLQIAFLSFTYGTNGITVPADKKYSVNLSDDSTIRSQLELAKLQNPDLICVCMHWGSEYQTLPNSEQKRLTTFLFDNGADLIIGNHPHVLQPMEKREITLSDGSKKDGFVVYSLGNFLADQNKTYTRDSAILNLNITKNNNDNIKINSATYVPIYMYNDKSKSSKRFKILDLKNTILSYNAGYNNIEPALYNKLNNEYNNIKKLLGEEIKQ